MSTKNPTKATKARPTKKRRGMTASERSTLREAEDILRNREIDGEDRLRGGRYVSCPVQDLISQAASDMWTITHALEEDAAAALDARTATDLMSIAEHSLRILITRLPGAFHHRTVNKAMELIAEMNARKNMEIRGGSIRTWYWS